MKYALHCQSAVLFAAAACVRVPLVAEIPPATFALASITVGVNTLDEVEDTYGAAKTSRVSSEDEAETRVCYSVVSPQGTSYLTFEAHVMGAYGVVTGFGVSIIQPNGPCVATKASVGILETGSGVRLGQSRAQVRRAIPVAFKNRGSKLSYETVTRRAASEEERQRLRARWPTEEQDYFDVTMSVTATFKDDRLVDFRVRRIESY